MDVITVLTKLIVLVEPLMASFVVVKSFLRNQRLFAWWFFPTVSYENSFLDLHLELRDAMGQEAVVRSRQRVRLLTSDAGVIRVPVWGEGDQFKHWRLKGARRLGRTRDGNREVLLLDVKQSVGSVGTATVESERRLLASFQEPNEYFESQVARPTRRLAISVTFPVNRPPKRAELVATPPTGPARPVPVRYLASGKAVLAWSKHRPDPFRLYSLRWSW